MIDLYYIGLVLTAENCMCVCPRLAGQAPPLEPVVRQGEDSIVFTFRDSDPHFGTDIYENGWGGRAGL